MSSFLSGLGSAASAAGNGIASGASAIGNGLSSAGSAAINGLSNVGNSIGSGLSTAANATADGLSSAGNYIGTQAQNLGEWISNAGKSTNATGTPTPPANNGFTPKSFTEFLQIAKQEQDRMKRRQAALALMQSGNNMLYGTNRRNN